MDRQAFKQRMQDLKSYRENNPGKGYWDWKVDAFDDGGVNGNLVGSYSNHTGTPTMYVPVTKEYEATPDGFGEIANVHTPEVVITPQSNISLEEAVDKGRRDAAPYVGAIVAGAALPAMSSTGGLGAAMDLSGIITDPLDPTNYLGFGVIKGLKKYKIGTVMLQIIIWLGCLTTMKTMLAQVWNWQIIEPEKINTKRCYKQFLV